MPPYRCTLNSGSQHLCVLAQHAGHIARAHHVQPDEPGVVGLRQGEQVPQVFLAGLVEPVVVHLQIAGKEVVEVEAFRVLAALGGLLEQVVQVLDLDDLHGRADLHKIAEDHTLHGHALVDDLVHHAGVDGGDDGALAGDDLHEVVLLQPLQHAADGGARDAEPLAQLVLAQRFAGEDRQ